MIYTQQTSSQCLSHFNWNHTYNIYIGVSSKLYWQWLLFLERIAEILMYLKLRRCFLGLTIYKPGTGIIAERVKIFFPMLKHHIPREWNTHARSSARPLLGDMLCFKRWVVDHNFLETSLKIKSRICCILFRLKIDYNVISSLSRLFLYFFWNCVTFVLFFSNRALSTEQRKLAWEEFLQGF